MSPSATSHDPGLHIDTDLLAGRNAAVMMTTTANAIDRTLDVSRYTTRIDPPSKTAVEIECLMQT
jgi:hypothetical protein